MGNHGYLRPFLQDLRLMDVLAGVSGAEVRPLSSFYLQETGSLSHLRITKDIP